ncbi:MAG: non-homologous end-joining DNA ligase [Anaerolineales bacterium]
MKELDRQEREKASQESFPSWMDPMLAKLTDDHFSDDDWIYERKLDGQRALAFLDPDGGIRLLSRNQNQLNDSYPEIEEALPDRAPGGCVFDGELVAFDEKGISDFQRLQPRMQSSSRKEARESYVKVYYYLFDCLYIDGHDISACALSSRKRLLKAALDWDDPIRWVQYRRGEGLDYYRQACEKGWEGVIAKRHDAPYVHSRSNNWLKFKCGKGQEFVIGGFTEPQGERPGFGALLLGFYRDGDFVFAGKVGTGFDDATLKDLRGRLDSIKRETSPFDVGSADGGGVHFVTPKFVCEVGFSEWTQDEKLRHPRFKGLRRDKDARDVHREAISQQADL